MKKYEIVILKEALNKLGFRRKKAWIYGLFSAKTTLNQCFLKKAAIELRDQEDYIRFEQDDPESADIFIQRFLSALERLEYFPYSCPAMILGKRQRRKLVVGNHIAVFRVDARRSIVFVEHVFHARRDYVKFL